MTMVYIEIGTVAAFVILFAVAAFTGSPRAGFGATILGIFLGFIVFMSRHV